MDYSEIIKAKYLAARGVGETGQNFELWSNETGIVIARWGLSDPQPTIEELDVYATSAEYLAGQAAKLLAMTLDAIDQGINQQVVAAGIASPYLFYAMKVADNAFTVNFWHDLGEPDVPVEWMDLWQSYIDSQDAGVLPTSDSRWSPFSAAVAEAQAYRLTTDPTMTPVKMIQTWEVRWMQMRRGFAELAYARRLQIEQARMTG